MGFLDICLNTILFVFKIICYPFIFLWKFVYYLFIKWGEFPVQIAIMRLGISSFLMVLWCAGALCITAMPGSNFLQGYFQYIGFALGTDNLYYNTDLGSYYETPTTAGINSTGVSYGGQTYYIDLSQINENTTVSLPSGTYTTGTVLQRAELLTIVQEICNRPEINVSPEIILGAFFTEYSAGFDFSGSLVSNIFKVSLDQDSCGGPFQISTGEMSKYGTAYISKIENPNLPDAERVRSGASAKSLPPIQGESRPSMFYFSDAAYTFALWFKAHYPDSAGMSKTNWTAKAGEYADKNNLNSYAKNALQINSALAYYNSYNATHKSWLPAFCGDLTKLGFELDSWSDLASSKSALLNKFKSDLLPNTKRTLPDMAEGYTYYDNYLTAFNNTNDISFRYIIYTHNGGKWVYDGLCALAGQIGSTVSNTQTNTTPATTTTVTNTSQFFDAQKLLDTCFKYIGKPYVWGGSLPSTSFDCSGFTSYCFKEACGITINRHSSHQLYNCTKIPKGQEQPGDICFYSDSGDAGIYHVGIVVDPNKKTQIDSGSDCGVKIRSYASGWYAQHLYCFGRIDKNKV